VKLVQNFGDFFDALMATRQRAIVERSSKDRFWGAVEEKDGHLHGENRLGRLLVELRNEVQTWLNAADDDDAEFPAVPPLSISDFRMVGREIGIIRAQA